MVTTVPGRDDLKMISLLSSWNLICKETVVSIDKPERERRIARYTSRDLFFTSCVKKSESRIRCVKCRAVLNVREEMTGISKVLDMTGDEQLYLPVTDGRYILKAVISGPDWLQRLRGPQR